MMVTFHPCVVASNRRRDGTYPVKIRVTFKGVSRRLATNLVARPGDLTRSLHIKSPDILNKAQTLIAQMQDTLADLSPFTIESWDVDRVISHIRGQISGQDFRLDFFAFADKYLDCKTASTRRNYDIALNALSRFLGERRLDVNEITRARMLDFVAFVDEEPKIWVNRRTGEAKRTDKPKRAGAAARHLTALECIFNAAKLRYNDDDRVLIPRSPFDGIPRDFGEHEGQKPLPLEVMQALIRADADGVERVALDVFLLSFATMGANLADLYAAPRFTGTTWTYCRKKITTRRAEMRVDIQPEVSEILGRLTGRGRWWLNVLHVLAEGGPGACTTKVNSALRRIAARMGLEPFTFYAARKSWATYARNICGIEKATVDEALAHRGDYAIADIYIARSWGHLNEANKKVLALLDWNNERTKTGGMDSHPLEEDAVACACASS